ncbi:hypothetical protein SBI_05113 [Streptomyces bingchenggensis BCW-1]|uniref:Type VI secretion protein n=1 Tax=Streptomyces bingchenggensis (strain BCW-1) TaxID=749414 RepID=D7C507_STRBB|nr:hypothetical protein SBI_05113 [Streptomyces bingchenggensis BCW-1]
MLFLLGLTGLVWTATGLAGLFAHGAWPDGVRFLRTPLAMRGLAQQPHNLGAAWPDTPQEQLSGYGLFWGLFISELMVLIVLTVFVVGTFTRYRAVRARRRTEAAETAEGHEYAPRTGATDGPGGPGAPGGPGRPGQDATPGRVPGHAADTAQAAQRGGDHGTAGTADRTTGGPVPAEPQADRQTNRQTDWQTDWQTGQATAVTGTPGARTAAPHHIAEQRADTWAGAGAEPPAEPTAASAQPMPTPRGGPGGGPSGGPGSGRGFPGAEVTHSRVLYGSQRGDAASQAVLDADGPVLVVTSDAALWTTTKDARAKFGPTHVFDPSHLLDTPARLRWNPAAGCESRDAAAARATALLAPVRPLHAVDRPMAEAAETMLRCWLHAAAVDGRPFRQVHRWAQGNSAHEPVRILRTHAKAAGGAAGELEATLTAHPERRDMAQELTARALAALSSIHIRDACNPGRSDTLALESFIGEGGTLYVMGESIEDPRTHPGAMPLLTALASHVVEHGRRMAERSSSGRLDPPLTLVLDDVAAVAPLPQLPDLLAQGAAQGLPTLALMRSQEQARARWPHRSLIG